MSDSKVTSSGEEGPENEANRGDTDVCGCDDCDVVCPDINTIDVFNKDNQLLPLNYRHCPKCERPTFVKHEETWHKISYFLTDEKRDPHDRKCALLKNDLDYLRLEILSQILFNNYELEDGESPYLPHPRDVAARLVWEGRGCVGFYTVKKRGASRTMDMVDTVYIRKSARRKGLGMFIVQHAVKELGSVDLGFGFSDPISDSLYKVLTKYLIENAGDRNRIWECSGDGGEGNRQNVWINIKLKHSHKRMKRS